MQLPELVPRFNLNTYGVSMDSFVMMLLALIACKRQLTQTPAVMDRTLVGSPSGPPSSNTRSRVALALAAATSRASRRGSSIAMDGGPASGRSRVGMPVSRSAVSTPAVNQDAGGENLGRRTPTAAAAGAGATIAESHDRRQEGNTADEAEEEFHGTIPVPREIRFVDADTTAVAGDAFATPPANQGPGAALADRGSPATSTGTSSSIRSHPNYAFLISGSAEAIRSGSPAGTNAGADDSPVSMRSLGGGSFVIGPGGDGDGETSNQDEDGEDEDVADFDESSNDIRGDDVADGDAAGGIAASGGDVADDGDFVLLAGDEPDAVGGGDRLRAIGEAILVLIRAAWCCGCGVVVGILISLWRLAPMIAKVGFAFVSFMFSWDVYEQYKVAGFSEYDKLRYLEGALWEDWPV
jgi:hypothetical protein